MKKPIREFDRFIIRLPDGMKERLARRAERTGRSMNSEILAILDVILEEPTHEAIRELVQQRRAIETEIRAANDHLRLLREKRNTIREKEQEMQAAWDALHPEYAEAREKAWAEFNERRERGEQPQLGRLIDKYMMDAAFPPEDEQA
jgi:DNA anti-recombination protein RmuC